jgi:hypothetical protein
LYNVYPDSASRQMVDVGLGWVCLASGSNKEHHGSGTYFSRCYEDQGQPHLGPGSCPERLGGGAYSVWSLSLNSA